VIARVGNEQNLARALVGSMKLEVVTAVLLRTQVRDVTLSLGENASEASRTTLPAIQCRIPYDLYIQAVSNRICPL
jgi:hypothetical protein